VTAASACTILQKRAQEDGSLLLNTMCEVEGEDGKSPADFTIRPSPKNRNRLILADDSGFVMGEVAQCR
jgi:hypothetical protein